jgi:7-cyano-7-deazaguanine synthase
MDKKQRKALVMFSGGQDSATCLAWALESFESVETIGFNYGQRHSVELEQRKIVLAEMRKLHPHWNDILGDDFVLDIPVLGQISDCALTKEAEITYGENGLPTSFVPARNLLFIDLAGALSYRRAIYDLVGGMCETDFSGYPDCRRHTIDSSARTLSLGLEQNYLIHTPLMHINKAQTWKMAFDIGGQEFVDLIIEHTHTCYLGDRSHRHEWGYGCGTCPACELRARGYEEWRG